MLLINILNKRTRDKWRLQTKTILGTKFKKIESKNVWKTTNVAKYK